MAFTFKKTLENVKIGNSLFDEEGAKIVAELEAKAKAKNVELVFPVDYVTGVKFSPNATVSPSFLSLQPSISPLSLALTLSVSGA